MRIHHSSPLRHALAQKCWEPTPAKEKAKPVVWTARELLAGYIKWLDINKNMDHSAIAKCLGCDRSFVYAVLERAAHPKVPDIKPVLPEPEPE